MYATRGIQIGREAKTMLQASVNDNDDDFSL